jgi:predicted glycoside hydrolase/deacetylase ChbG (UPF0249 family)
VVTEQLDEFQRLCGHLPTHIDGHRHMHLSPTVLLSGALPVGMPVRCSYTFATGEKNIANRGVRAALNLLVRTRHPTPRLFLDIRDFSTYPESAAVKVHMANQWPVEVMCHPEVPADWAILNSHDWEHLLREYPLGTFGPSGLPSRRDP